MYLDYYMYLTSIKPTPKSYGGLARHGLWVLEVS